jgi:hypothetical protein
MILAAEGRSQERAIFFQVRDIWKLKCHLSYPRRFSGIYGLGASPVRMEFSLSPNELKAMN